MSQFSPICFHNPYYADQAADMIEQGLNRLVSGRSRNADAEKATTER
jgi:hypothetical protein